MASNINDIVNVVITRDTVFPSSAGFGIPLILGVNKGFTTLQKSYSNVAEVGEDFSTESDEYKAASALMAQSTTVTEFKIGRRQTGDATTLTVESAVSGFNYSVTVNGAEATYQATGGDTTTTIATALKTAIDGLSEPIIVVDNLDGTLTINPTVATTPYALKIGSNMSLTFVTSQTITEDLNDIEDENGEWFNFMYTGRGVSDVTEVAAWAETVFKYYYTASSDVNIVDQPAGTDITSVAYVFNNNAYDNSAVVYDSLASSQFLDAAIIGMYSPLTPGSYNVANKVVRGVDPTKLTSSQRGNAHDKKANTFERRGGANIVRLGTSGSGEYTDVIIFSASLQEDIQTSVFNLLVNEDKVPFTDGGIASVEAELIAALQRGVDAGGIAPEDAEGNPGFTTKVPLASSITQGDKAARVLNGVEFCATLAGAINIVNINGKLTLS